MSKYKITTKSCQNFFRDGGGRIWYILVLQFMFRMQRSIFIQNDMKRMQVNETMCLEVKLFKLKIAPIRNDHLLSDDLLKDYHWGGNSGVITGFYCIGSNSGGVFLTLCKMILVTNIHKRFNKYSIFNCLSALIIIITFN